MEICGLVTEKNEPGMNSHVSCYLFAKLKTFVICWRAEMFLI